MSKSVAHALPAILPMAGWDYALSDDELEKVWSWRANLDASGPFETRIVFHYKSPQDYWALRITGDAKRAEIGFWRVTNGHAARWGEPAAVMTAPHGQLTVQRSTWRVRALWNGHALVSAFSDMSGAHFGTATRGEVKLSEARMQPVEAPNFEDDFMRAQAPDAPEAPNDWHRVAGIWKTSGLIGPRADAALNPNPFVFRAEVPGGADGSALATVGKWFWSDYTVTASVRPTLRDLSHLLVAGLVAYHQAGGAAVSGLVDFQTGRAMLRVGNRTLATSAPFRLAPNQWHRLFLDPGPGVARLVVDGVERVRTTGANGAKADLAQGEPALYAQLGGGNYVDFDDVRVSPNDAVSDDFQRAAVGRWEDAQGNWQTQDGQRVKISAGPALTLTGNPEREEGRVEANFRYIGSISVELPSISHFNLGPVGAVFAARDARNYFMARKRPRVPLEIIEVADGMEKVLATAVVIKGVNYKDNDAVRLTYFDANAPKVKPVLVADEDDNIQFPISVEWHEGVITARLRDMVATATVSAVPEGRVGAWAEGAKDDVALTSFHALGAAPSWGEGALPVRFQKDTLMENWASNARAWQPGDDGTWWHSGDFYQDASLTMPLPKLDATSSLTLLLAASPIAVNRGARLVMEPGAGGVALKLSEGGQLVKSVTLPENEATGELRFVRRPLGEHHVLLRVALGDRVILNETANSAGAAATKVGVRLAKLTPPDWEKVTATTSHLLDYTFTSAPVDWEASAGRWDVSERWTCSPQWGFFMGLNSVHPTLWSRFAARGDFTLEAYLATPMDQTRGERGPHDLNVTVDGDGRDLASGYSFLFDANQQRSNRVLRGDAIVIDKPFEVPPPKGSLHQDWFYVRLERHQTPQGLHFRYSVNGRVLMDYIDPHPLPGALLPGHIAFWTYNGALSIARVRLWHSGVESESQHSTPVTLPLVTTNSTSALKNALGEWLPRYEGVTLASARLQAANAGGQHATQIVNPQSGGDWTAYITHEPFEATQRPIVRFNYRVPTGVRVNLYAKVEGRWREIAFTGDMPLAPNIQTGAQERSRSIVSKPLAAISPVDIAQPANQVDTSVTIGRIEHVMTDSQWHTASFDLRAALQSANLSAHVESLAFAAPDQDYLRAGLGGNHAGATYWISDFQAPLAIKQTVAAAP